MRDLKHALAVRLSEAGVSANFVTYLGFLIAIISGIVISQGHFFTAGIIILLSGFLDMLDGTIARLQEDLHYFGGILDSSLDRYADSFIMGGVLFYCVSVGSDTYVFLAFSAMVAAFGVSYVRARAECEVESCRVGFWERGERVVVIAVALLLDNVPAALWILGTLPHFSFIYRLWFSKEPRSLAVLSTGRTNFENFLLDTRRSIIFYPIKCVILVLLLLAWRPSF